MKKQGRLTELARSIKLSLFSTSTAGIVMFGLTPYSAAPMAQELPDANEGEPTTEIEQITVTGSRIRQPELTTTSPMAVLGAPDYKLAGTTNVETLLNAMPQVIAGEGGYTNNEGSGVATVNLRGLGIQRSLVLVNGRRWIFFDSRQVADLNTIPAALVERTELITGGSSAVYGSDAVGGVVNFILKDDFEGVSLTGQYQISGEGDADIKNIDLAMGGNFADDKGNAVVFLNYFNREGVLAGARDQSTFFLVDSVDENGNPILVPGGSSTIPNGRISGFPTGGPELAARPGVQQALADLGLTGVGPFGFKFDETGDNVSSFISPGDQYNFNPLNYLQLPQERRMLGGMAEYALTDTVESYVEAIFTNNIVEQKFAPETIVGSHLIQVDSPFLPPGVQDLFSALDATEGTLVFDANGQPVLGSDGLPIITPAATRDDGYTSVSIARRAVELGTRDTAFERNAWRVVTGVRGDLGDVGFLKDSAFDVNYSFARTRNVTNLSGNALASAFEQAVTTEFDPSGNLVCTNPTNGCVPINIFGPFISEEASNFIVTRQTTSEEASMQVVTASLTGNLLELPGGALGAAVGAEYRTVSGLFVPSRGGVGDLNTGPSGGEYDITEGFGELRIPILESVDLSAAFRYSNYSLPNVGGSWTYGAGINWDVMPSLMMLRGRYQRAVRAPSIDELFAAQTGGDSPAATDPCALPSASTNPVIRDLCIANGVSPAQVGNPGLQPNFQIRDIVGGNPNLKEETADTYAFGAVLSPDFAPGLIATIDYFHIQVDDAISVLGGSSNNVLDLCFNQIQDINSPFCQAVVRAPSGIIENPGGVFVLNENIGKIETDGIDVHVNYGFDIGFGFFDAGSAIDIAAGVTWLSKFDVTPVVELPDLVDECAGSFGLTCGEPIPEYKSVMRATWHDGPLTTRLSWHWTRSVTDDQITSGEKIAAELAAPFTGSVNYVDITTSLQIGDNYDVTFGIQNLFNKEQPLLGSSQKQLNTWPNTYDPVGRRFFLAGSIHF